MLNRKEKAWKGGKQLSDSYIKLEWKFLIVNDMK